jgi:hypothetical protein
LAWFTIGLGLAELLAPRAVGRLAGTRGKDDVIRAFGVREIANGLCLLAAQNKAPWLWARIGGDGLDLATLATDYTDENPGRERVLYSMAAVAGVTLLDAYAAQGLSRERREQTELVNALLLDYGRRSGFPEHVEMLRGAAADAPVPADMRQPPALQPWPDTPRAVSDRTGVPVPGPEFAKPRSEGPQPRPYSAASATTQTSQSEDAEASSGAPVTSAPMADSLSSPGRG